ncbi:MAG TPA: hypothetical protein PK007_09905, partial [Candidatus Kapabacteria bacterium]|nr:hypothetical protein [Candidatus Kapabacteria bacterium]
MPGIGLQYRGKDPQQKYFFHTIFNKDTADATFVNQWTDSLVNFSVAGNNIYNGFNELKILNRRIDSSNGLLGVDFFRFQERLEQTRHLDRASQGSGPYLDTPQMPIRNKLQRIRPLRAGL